MYGGKGGAWKGILIVIDSEKISLQNEIITSLSK